MRKITLLFFVVFLGWQVACAQSFSNSTGGPVPDNALTCFPIPVSGLANRIDSTQFGLVSVCINLQHGFVGQLDLILKAPDGTQVKLSNNRGGNRSNFTNTCFRENGSILIQVGIAPFTGPHVPDESINAVNNNQNPNGLWQLCVLDEVPGITGSLQNVTLQFGNNPPPTPLLSICSLSNGRNCKCPDGTQNCELLPDMTNSEKVVRTQNSEFNGRLSIGVGTPNIGYGPLEMRGTNECFCDSTPVNCNTVICPNGLPPKQKVIQRVYRKDSARISFTDRPAGFFQYHPTHGHIHLENWTWNSLRTRGPNPDPTTWPVLGSTKKVSFCLVNLANCNNNLGYCANNLGQPMAYADAGNPGLGQVSGCGTEQGIYPGYIDIYSVGLEGQDINFGDICNGYYYIVSITDPTNLVKEMDETNNVSVVPILLSQQMGDCCKTDFSADTLVGTAPLRVQFIDKTAPQSDTWNWDFGDGTRDNTQFPVHTYTKPGIYSVKLSTRAWETNCRDSLTKQNFIIVRGPATPDNIYNVHVYPNPFNDQFTVYYQLTKSQTVRFRLLDAAGKLLQVISPETRTAGLHSRVFNTLRLPAGVYTLGIMIDNDIKYVKVVKQ